MRQIVDEVKKVTGLPFTEAVMARRAGDPPHLIGSPKRINEEMGWRAKYDVEDIVKSAWEDVYKRQNESRSSVTYSDASGSVSAGAGASIDRAYSLIGQSMDCTALVSQALAARGINFHGWPEEYVNVPGRCV